MYKLYLFNSEILIESSEKLLWIDELVKSGIAKTEKDPEDDWSHVSAWLEFETQEEAALFKLTHM